MNRGQKNILSMIVFIIITIIILLILLVSIDNESSKNNLIANENIHTITNNTENLIQESNVPPNGFTIVEDKNQNTEMSILKAINNRTVYFTIKDLTTNYIKHIGFNSKNMLEDMVSEEYIKQHNVDNITEITKVPKAEPGQHYEIIITNVLTAQIQETQHIFIVSGKGRINETNETFNIDICIRLDEENSLYAIYPYNYLEIKGYNKLKNGDIIVCEKEELKENKNNKFKYMARNDYDMAQEYFYTYNELLMHYKEEAYNKLDSKYSEKRYGSFENFQTYTIENINTIKEMEITGYTVYFNENYQDFICTDKYENVYIFRKQDGIMDYTVFLDGYTVMTEWYKEKLDKLNKDEKTENQYINFIYMLNTKDYNAIYNVLDENFKQSKFKNVEELKQYITNNLYDLTDIELEEYDNDTYEYSVFKGKAFNIRNKEERVDIIVIINSQEDGKYTMSFTVGE